MKETARVKKKTTRNRNRINRQQNECLLVFKFCIFDAGTTHRATRIHTHTFQTKGNISICLYDDKKTYCFVGRVMKLCSTLQLPKESLNFSSVSYFIFLGKHSRIQIQSGRWRYIGWQLCLTLFFHASYFISQTINQSPRQNNYLFVLSHYVYVVFFRFPYQWFSFCLQFRIVRYFFFSPFLNWVCNTHCVFHVSATQRIDTVYILSV